MACCSAMGGYRVLEAPNGRAARTSPGRPGARRHGAITIARLIEGRSYAFEAESLALVGSLDLHEPDRTVVGRAAGVTSGGSPGTSWHATHPRPTITCASRYPRRSRPRPRVGSPRQPRGHDGVLVCSPRSQMFSPTRGEPGSTSSATRCGADQSSGCYGLARSQPRVSVLPRSRFQLISVSAVRSWGHFRRICQRRSQSVQGQRPDPGTAR